MQKKILSAVQYLFFLTIGLILVWWQLSGMTQSEKREFDEALLKANYAVVLPIVLMNLLSHLSRAIRWKLLMKPLDYNPKLKNVFCATMVGYLANLAVPRLGEILKCTLLSKYEHLKTDKLIGSILVERTFDFCCYLLFIFLTVIIQIEVIGGYVQEKLALTTANNGSGWIKWLILFGVFIAGASLLFFFFKRFPENKIIVKVRRFISGMIQGFISIRNLKERKKFALHTFIIWALYLLQIYVGFKAIEGTQHLGIKAACAVLSLSTLAMIITPGGLGAFPFFVMETLLMYNISETQGKALGWLIWGVSTGLFIIAGVISAILLPYLNKKKNEVSTGNIKEDPHD